MKENTTSDRVKDRFKSRFHKHCNSFKYESKANSTELSKHFWEMKRKGIKKPIMHWSVIGQAKPYQNGSKGCNLCLKEKYHILTSPVNLINKRSEVVSKCRNESKFELVNYKAIHRLISKTKMTISNYGNMSNFIKNRCIWIIRQF